MQELSSLHFNGKLSASFSKICTPVSAKIVPYIRFNRYWFRCLPGGILLNSSTAISMSLSALSSSSASLCNSAITSRIAVFTAVIFSPAMLPEASSRKNNTSCLFTVPCNSSLIPGIKNSFVILSGNLTGNILKIDSCTFFQGDQFSVFNGAAFTGWLCIGPYIIRIIYQSPPA